MLKSVLFTLWFFLPAGVANATPVFMAKLPGIRRWDAPLDFGKTWKKRPLLGKNKTWRGLISGMILATLVLWLQQWLVAEFAWAGELTSQIDYHSLPLVMLGPLFGAGALIGDAAESFFKRQKGVAAGHSWFPFDQIDFIVGGAIAVLPIVRLELVQYLWLLVIWLVMHLLVSYVGYLLKLKERPI